MPIRTEVGPQEASGFWAIVYAWITGTGMAIAPHEAPAAVRATVKIVWDANELTYLGPTEPRTGGPVDHEHPPGQPRLHPDENSTEHRLMEVSWNEEISNDSSNPSVFRVRLDCNWPSTTYVYGELIPEGGPSYDHSQKRAPCGLTMLSHVLDVELVYRIELSEGGKKRSFFLNPDEAKRLMMGFKKAHRKHKRRR